MFKIKIIIFIILNFSISAVFALSSKDPEVEKFINEMVNKHHFLEDELITLFSQVSKSQSILDAISRPAEKKLTWGQYRKIFIDGKRSLKGMEFWNKYRADLERAHQIYGVPPEMIVAIIGVETRFGKFTGKHKVIDALSTLGFYYPKRAKFFRKQLEEFLLLCVDQNVDPLTLYGSYAGAMGIPQFIPSSYRHYAIDFDDDNKIDIWNNPVDAIGSVANYFHMHKWHKDEEIVVRASISGDAHKSAEKNQLKPKYSKEEIVEKFKVKPVAAISDESKYSLLELETDSQLEYWVGMHNFYVITRYNHSHLYAMAAYQLSQEIKRKFLSR